MLLFRCKLLLIISYIKWLTDHLLQEYMCENAMRRYPRINFTIKLSDMFTFCAVVPNPVPAHLTSCRASKSVLFESHTTLLGIYTRYWKTAVRM